MKRPAADLALLAAVLAVVGAFAVVPAAVLFERSIGPTGGATAFAAVWNQAQTRRAFDNSLLQGGLSAALAVGVGYPAGVFLGRYRWPGRGAVRSAILLPFLLPSLVMVLGTLDLLGPQGLLGGPAPAFRWFAHGVPGIIAVNLLYNVPIVVVLTATGCEASSAALEETVATLGGSPARAYVETWAWPSWIGALCGGLLTFVLSALSFAPPILLCGSRCDTVEVRVYRLAEITGQPYTAGVLALLLVGAFLAPAVAYLLLARRLRPAPGSIYHPRVPSWRSPATWGLAVGFGAVVACEGALVVAVLVRSLVPPGGGRWAHGWQLLFAPATAAHLGTNVSNAVANTLFFAALAAAVGFVVASASAFLSARRPGWATPLALVLFVPILLSPVVLAEALATFWRPALGGSANVWVLIVLSQALLGVPFALQALEIPLAGLGRHGREVAATLGATPWTAFVDVELPRVRRGIQSAVLFAFALGMGEFTATNFLVTPKTTTLPVAVYTLQNARLLPAASAATGLLLLVSLGLFGLIVASGGDVSN
jgi:thiamine transport system permease protein